MKLYNVSISDLIIRFHLFTALIVILGFAGYLYFGIVIGMVLFLSSIMGLQFNKKIPEAKTVRAHYEIPVSFKNVHIPAHRYNIWHQRHHWAAH